MERKSVLNDRIHDIIVEKELTPSLFADEIGVQRSSISHILANRNKPSLEVIHKIVRKYPDISFDWFMEGVEDEYENYDKEAATTNSEASDALKRTNNNNGGANGNGLNQNTLRETSGLDFRKRPSSMSPNLRTGNGQNSSVQSDTKTSRGTFQMSGQRQANDTNTVQESDIKTEKSVVSVTYEHSDGTFKRLILNIDPI